VSNHIRGAGCPFCVNKTEAKLYEQMFPLYPTLIIQFKQDWCKNIQYLRFDFCIPESKIIIELDGRQHFQQVSNWKTPEEHLIRDKYKERCANDNGYSVIRLLQEDVFYDTYDWIKELRETIDQIKSWNDIANVYLCKNDEYELY
jgi:very-short-patch-repair endonuclease